MKIQTMILAVLFLISTFLFSAFLVLMLNDITKGIAIGVAVNVGFLGFIYTITLAARR